MSELVTGPCPVCGASDGFHDDGPHVAARGRIPAELRRPSHSEARRQQKHAAGPPDDDLVWVAVRRRGIVAHRIGFLTVNGVPHTGCDRSMRTGEQLTAAVARHDLHVLWCGRPGCWPSEGSRG